MTKKNYQIRSPPKLVGFCWVGVLPSNWSNVIPACGSFCYDELLPWLVDVPNKSKPKMSSFDLGAVAFFACPGPIMALLVYVFFYFLAF